MAPSCSNMTTSAQGKVHKGIDVEFGLEEIDCPAQSSGIKTFWMIRAKTVCLLVQQSLSELIDGLLKE